ncbi:MAG: UvrD-helicase domain-containing protein, partial [Desulfobacteraceae bacterium]|nr:UvrD-helicase domain-containing protein [Desulfobacteraceae bacterium]
MKPLDPFHIDLEKTTLIEASAGTGKTYTIATLYCRLVAKGYALESILVVTFTEAAAAELKLRIRRRLFDTLENLQNPSLDHTDDLVDFFKQKQDLSKICKRLKLALISFDQAAIMTIHSFCLKVLKENAFESQSYFDIELVPDRSLFLRQVCYDFFMGHVNNQDSLFLSYLAQRQITPEHFAQIFGSLVSRSNLVILPQDSGVLNIFDTYRETIKKIQDILFTKPQEVIDLIGNHTGIDKRSYSKKNVPAWLKASREKIEETGLNTLFKMTEKGDALFKFVQSRIAQKTKSGAQPPDHELFNLCEQLLCLYTQFEKNLIHLKIEFLDFFNTELEKIKKANGICFFDDLVNDLAKALEGDGEYDQGKPNSHYLKKAVRQKYTTCLIDEFQDTDPRQYDIFSTLFSCPGTPFFMIGDPKQAIYAFRGGDIFAYLKASKECEQKYTLEKNYRSAPLLVKGINEIFSNTKNPFLFEAIEFSNVKTPETAINYFFENENPIAPLQFCFIKREDHLTDRQGLIKKDTAAAIIPKAVAIDIVSLLNSDKCLMDKESKRMSKISP